MIFRTSNILFGTLSSAVFPAFCTMIPKVCPIMCDDMSFYDVVCYCGEVKIPILDRLVTEGMRFIQFCTNAKFHYHASLDNYWPSFQKMILSVLSLTKKP